jgi:uncharacterized protein (TIGR03435 family)
MGTARIDSTWVRLAVVTAVMTLCGAASACLWGQDVGRPTPMKSMAKEADPNWEVATVKASDPNDSRGHDFFLNGHRVGLRDTTVRQLLLLGYGVQKSQLAGLPDWAVTTRWDVDGIPDTEGQPSFRQLQGMVRKLLGERFGLQLHREQREMSVLALMAAKGIPKLIANTSDPNGWLRQITREDDGGHVEELKNVSMAELAIVLQYYVDLPVIDQTGLKGRYDFNLKWTMQNAQETAPDAPPSLFTAIQEQIGLKLGRVTAPADVLVVDKVTRPEAN